VDQLGTAAPLTDVLALLGDHLAAEVPSCEHRIVRFVDGVALHPDGGPAAGDPLLPPVVLDMAAVASAGCTTLARAAVLPPSTQAAMVRQLLTTCFVHPITVQERIEPMGAVVSWATVSSLPLGVRACVETTARLAGIAMAVHGTADDLRSAAMIDSLTGLGNRRQLDEWVGRLDGPAAVLAVDVDHFKAVNDRHGHAAGDLVLAELARRLRSSCRPDAVLARPGGDEFVVILPGLRTAAQAEAVTARFVLAMRRPISVGGADLEVSASAGWAIRRPGEAMVDALVRADASLYAMKARRAPGARSPVV
jgi:diguanylate cyclase (GGDEF)-like protein